IYAGVLGSEYGYDLFDTEQDNLDYLTEAYNALAPYLPPPTSGTECNTWFIQDNGSPVWFAPSDHGIWWYIEGHCSLGTGGDLFGFNSDGIFLAYKPSCDHRTEVTSISDLESRISIE